MTNNSPATETVTERMIQALHAGISQRSWSDVENAANVIRDAVHVSRIRAETAKNSGEAGMEGEQKIERCEKCGGLHCGKITDAHTVLPRARWCCFNSSTEGEQTPTPANNRAKNSGEVVGWRLVPIIPTDRMIEDAGQLLSPSQTLTECYDQFKEIWDQALASSPPPPTPANSRAEAIGECIEYLAACGEASLNNTNAPGDFEQIKLHWQSGARAQKRAMLSQLRALLQQEGE